ncbi:MAG: anthranilate synthase component I [Clostridia bacterium]|nr:anthranilate synthase component I [Clostridia bacterium]
MFYPTKEEYLKLGHEYNLIPVSREMVVDLETPISICLKLGLENISYLLESVEGGENLARYSFLGLKPFLTYRNKNSRGIIEEDGQVTELADNPLETLEQIMGRFKAPQMEGLPRFYGGAVGYFGYDVVRYIEELPVTAPDELELPDGHFVITGLVLIFDHVKHKLKIVANTRVGANPEAAYEAGIESINSLVKILNGGGIDFPLQNRSDQPVKITSNMTKDEYVHMVEKAKDYIKAGDIFQVVLSQRFRAPLAANPFDIYRSLRTVNPAPYLFFLNFGDTIIIGSSPEMLVRVEDGVVQTMPIAGTRPRGRNQQEDRLLAEDLLADAKERAEHLMLVDLGRNDLGRVCKYGTVRVSDFMLIENYSHVMHLVSNVQGELEEGKSDFDALRACFPAGTLSGAPKVRAMEIIEELEPSRRGSYGGVIGYFGFTGNMDTCITIRTLLVHGDQVYVQAGAGIVADSDPEKEYEETINKAKALLKTLQQDDSPDFKVSVNS